jgi:hypothetical protein
MSNLNPLYRSLLFGVEVSQATGGTLADQTYQTIPLSATLTKNTPCNNMPLFRR